MKKRRIPILLIALSAGLGIALLSCYLFLIRERRNYPDAFGLRPSEPVVGVYSRNPSGVVETAREMPHYYLQWISARNRGQPPALAEALSGGRPVLLTLEIWGKKSPGSAYNPITEMVNAGRYDARIRRLCAILKRSKSPVYLRFNPEMEVPVRRYPWQGQGARFYAKAFRRVARIVKAEAPDVRIVWGPAGFPGALEYFPGREWADAASVTLDSPSELLSDIYPREDSTALAVKRKLHRLRFVDKPVFILGSPRITAGSFRDEWLAEAVESMKSLPPVDLSIDPDSTYLFLPPAGFQRPADAPLMLGVYDPLLRLVSDPSVSVEHLFVDWGSLGSGKFQEDFEGVLSRNHDVIVTMEPWRDPALEKDPEILVKTLNGELDAEYRKLYALLESTDRTIYLRFIHEMEIPTDRYPWQSQDPVLYIKAFRHFVTLRDPAARNIRIVWGPAGDRGSLEFWPGEDVVDYISFAIYGLPDKNITDHNQQESFRAIFDRKLFRMRFVKKPIFITEFGVKGPESYQKAWMEAAARTVNQHPEVVGINYFNLFDSPKAWGDIEAPDWSIDKNTFRHFAKGLIGLGSTEQH